MRGLLEFDVSGMDDDEIGNLLEIVLFVERQDFGDAVILHDHAVNYVSYS